MLKKQAQMSNYKLCYNCSPGLLNSLTTCLDDASIKYKHALHGSHLSEFSFSNKDEYILARIQISSLKRKFKEVRLDYIKLKVKKDLTNKFFFQLGVIQGESEVLALTKYNETLQGYKPSSIFLLGNSECNNFSIAEIRCFNASETMRKGIYSTIEYYRNISSLEILKHYMSPTLKSSWLNV